MSTAESLIVLRKTTEEEDLRLDCEVRHEGAHPL